MVTLRNGKAAKSRAAKVRTKVRTKLKARGGPAEGVAVEVPAEGVPEGTEKSGAAKLPAEGVPEGAELFGVRVPRNDWTADQCGQCCVQCQTKGPQLAWLIGHALNVAAQYFNHYDGSWRAWQMQVNPGLGYSTIQRYRELAKRVPFSGIDEHDKMMKAYKDAGMQVALNAQEERKRKAEAEEARGKAEAEIRARLDKAEAEWQGKEAKGKGKGKEVEGREVKDAPPPVTIAASKLTEYEAYQALENLAFRVEGGVKTLQRLLAKLARTITKSKRGKRKAA